MLLSTEHPASCTYQVEVSGWDQNETFFVENSELSWDEQVGKQVGLRHMLNEVSMVFVRLLKPVTLERTFPVAYLTEFVGMDSGRHYQFRLKPRCPLG
jgi:hypothetical protein